MPWRRPCSLLLKDGGMMKTRDLTIGAMCCGLSVLFLYIASIIPTGKIAAAFIATLMPAVACAECDKKVTSLVCGIASGLLAGLIVPKSGMAGVITVFFCGVFCYYPWLKHKIEMLNKLAAEWLFKLIFFSIVSIVLKLIGNALGIEIFNVIVSVIILAAYDLLVSYVMEYYLRVISPKIKSQMKG